MGLSGQYFLPCTLKLASVFSPIGTCWESSPVVALGLWVTRRAQLGSGCLSIVWLADTGVELTWGWGGVG